MRNVEFGLKKELGAIGRAKKARVSLLIILCYLASAPLLSAFDWGLVLDQTANYGGFGNDSSFAYSGSLIPWFSTLLGDNSDIYVSAGIQASYSGAGIIVPDLLRTELSFYSGFMELKAGRSYYTDPLGFIAEGLFDGARASFFSGAGTFSVGAWYTGFLYKKRADIIMTSKEMEAYVLELDYNDFVNTYFAPRRLLAALDWEHLSLGTAMVMQAQVSLLGQFDLSGKDTLHSQYAVGKITFPFNLFSLNMGGSLELIQEGSDFCTAFAAELGAALFLPIALQSRLSFLARYSSGGLGNSGMVAFKPLTAKTQGEILKAKLSGISMLSLEYLLRLHNAFSAGISSGYFIRNDLKTYSGYPALGENSKGYFLGNEFFAWVLWSPYSDFQLNLGGGLFLPSLGDAAPEADISWRVELNAILSL